MILSGLGAKLWLRTTAACTGVKEQDPDASLHMPSCTYSYDATMAISGGIWGLTRLCFYAECECLSFWMLMGAFMNKKSTSYAGSLGMSCS